MKGTTDRLLFAAALAFGCGQPGADGTGDATSTGSETETTGGFEGTLELLDATPVVAAGGVVYLETNELIGRLDVEVGGVVLGPPAAAIRVEGEALSGLYRLPIGLALGSTEIEVRREQVPEDVASREIEVVAPAFAEVADATGLAQTHDPSGNPDECAESHTGLAFADYDNDGDPDAYVGHYGSEGKLFRNPGAAGGQLPELVEVTEQAGLAGIDQVAMASFMDYDNDGDRDLFVGRRGRNTFLQNRLSDDGVAEFHDVTKIVGLGDADQRTMGVGWGDYDGDGDLDLYVVNHAFCFPTHGSEIRAQDHLYRNDAGTFVEVTNLLGQASFVLDAVGFSAVWLDYDGDDDQDLFVINDDVGGYIGNPNVLWRNDGPGAAPDEWVFTDVSEASGFAVSGQGGTNAMGVAVGDVNQDGQADLAFSNIGPNYLLLNDGAGGFVDMSENMGIQRETLPWGALSITWGTHLFDYDNDGDLDLYFVGGRIKGSAPVPDAMFRQDSDGGFTDVTWQVGLADPAGGKASALVDLDRDGFVEFATANWAGPLRVYHNEAAEDGAANHWLAVDLVGTSSNRDALGATVQIESPDGRVQTCFRTPNPSLGAGGELGCHFGLGSNTTLVRLTVRWPDGRSVDVSPPAVDQRVVIIE